MASAQTYLFKAMTPSGGTKLGVRAAVTTAVLAEDLKREQLLMLRAWKLPLGPAPENKIPLKDDALLNEQLFTLLSRGVPLVETLEVAASVVSPKSRLLIEKMRESVAAGASFSSACEKIGGFDSVSTAVYRSAERTGDLSGAAKRLADAARRRLAISGKAITVMIYPAVVTVIAALLFTALLVFLVPQIAHQMEQMKTTIPLFSKIVFGFGTFLNTNIKVIGLIVALLLVGMVIFWRAVVAVLVKVAAKLPGVSSLLLSVELTRFFSVLAAMTRSGVPLADALSNAVPVISGQRLRVQLEALRKNLVDGGVLRVLIDRVDQLPLATRKLLIAAERAGDLDSAFDSLSAEMASDVDRKSSRLLAVLEPAVIVGMFGLLGPLIIAIAVPLITFGSNSQ